MLGLHKIKSSLSEMAMKEGGHVSELLLFLDITSVCFFFQQKRKWLEIGRERKKLLRK